MKFALPVKAVINAQKCQAKYDVRYYLEGFHVTKGSVVATNGHYLYQANLKNCELPDYMQALVGDNELPESVIINMVQQIKPPIKRAGCEYVLFEIAENDVIATTIDHLGGKIAVYLGKVVDGKFPDVNKIIPSEVESNFAEIGINADYLKKLHEICDGNFKAVHMKCHGQDKPIVFDIKVLNCHYESKFVLMPLKI